MAHGIYGRQGSTELDLRLIDPASAGALLAQSAATGAQGHKESETTATIERSYREGARSVSELRWKDSNRIEISYVLANGVRLTAQASAIRCHRPARCHPPAAPGRAGAQPHGARG